MKNKTINKVCISLICIWGLVFASSCSRKTEDEDKDTFYVEPYIVTEDKIYIISMEYCIDGEPIGGGFITNADGSQIANHDKTTYTFYTEDFPEGADLSKFSIQFFVGGEAAIEALNGGSPYDHPAQNVVKDNIELNAQYGECYVIEISGNSTDGYNAVLK